MVSTASASLGSSKMLSASSSCYTQHVGQSRSVTTSTVTLHYVIRYEYEYTITSTYEYEYSTSTKYEVLDEWTLSLEFWTAVLVLVQLQLLASSFVNFACL